MLHVVDEKQTNKTLNHVINLSQTYILQKKLKVIEQKISKKFL